MASSNPLYVMDPPPGEVRHTVDIPNSAGAVMPSGLATTIIAFACVALRIFTRTYVVKGVLGVDDYLCLCALASALSYLGVSFHLMDVGSGTHMWDVKLADYSPGFLQTSIAATLTYALAISFAKLSILTFYLRISPDRSFRRAVYGLVGLVVVYTVTYFLLIIFQCRPVDAQWDVTVEGTCIGNMTPMMVLSIANIMIDFIILCVPVKVVVPLQIPRRQKASLIFLFATGGFVVAAAIKRTVIMPPLLTSSDYTWELPPQVVWSYIEVNAGLVCASVPALKPLFMRYLPFLLASRLRSSQAKYGGSGSNNQLHGSGGGGHGTDRKRSHKVYSQSYELPSRDELPETGPRKDDDEAQLFSRRAAAAEKPQALHAVDAKHDDSDSLDSLSDRYPGRRPAAGATVSAGYGNVVVGNPGGIKVTKDTYVSYGP